MSFKLPDTGKLYRGDTIHIYMTLTEDDEASNLTGWDLWFTAKKDLNDTDNAATTIQKRLGAGIVFIDQLVGQIKITLLPNDTSSNNVSITYVCDIQGKDPGGEIHTFDDGTMTISVDVTRATT